MEFSRNPARAARRKAEALEHLGTEQARCVYCGKYRSLFGASRVE